MRIHKSPLVAAVATALTIAAAGAAATPASPGGTGRDKAMGAAPHVGPLEVVETYAAEHAGEWFWPGAAVSDPTGVVTAAWSDRGVQVAQRATDGTWTAPTTLFSCHYGASCDYGNARLSTDSAGNVTAVWEQTSAGEDVYYSTHAPGGTWTPPAKMSTGERFAGGYIDLAGAENGAAVVSYTGYVPGKGWGTIARYRPAGASWAQARTHLFKHQVAFHAGISATGVVVVAASGNSPTGKLLTYR